MKNSSHHYELLIYILWMSLGAAFVLAMFRAQWSTAFIALATYLLTTAPYFLKRKWKIHVPNGFLFSIIFFIYASIFLGEVHDFYERFAWWDALLHLTSAIGFALVGFVALLLIDENKKIKTKPIIVALIAFCFSVALAALWEIFEFAMDQIFGFNMQKNGLLDTMWDLIIGSLGALIATVSGYFYITRKHRGFLNQFIHETLRKNRKRF